MANKEHIDILYEEGKDAWNLWREENPNIVPDLSDEEHHVKTLLMVNLNGVNLSKVNLSGEDIVGIQLNKADLTEADLSGAHLYGADFTEANLTEANLSGAYLCALYADPDTDEIMFDAADLSGANLNGANLLNANFRGANLSSADLRGAFLINSDFSHANLSGSDLRGADLSYANFTNANLHGADIRGARLICTSLVEANLINANLSDCYVYGVSAWKIQLDDTIQSNLTITPPNEPAITVESLEIAQFIYLLLEHKKLRDILNSVTERGVLILGRFGGGGLELLQAIAAKLRDINYLPMIFDFERPEYRDFTETVMTLAGLSRFVIVDLSGPSVPNELRATIPHIKIPYVLIIEEERKIFSMFSDLLGYPWVLPPVEFTSKEHLMELLPSSVIEPAEEKFRERQALLNRLFNR